MTQMREPIGAVCAARWCSFAALRWIVPAAILFAVVALHGQRSVVHAQTSKRPASRPPTASPPTRPLPATAITRVQLAANSAPPGTIATLPLYFRPAAGVVAGQLSAMLKFTGEELVFQGAELSAVSRKAGLELASEVQQDGAGAKRKTTVRLSLKVAGNSAITIPSGVVATVRFKVADNAPHGGIPIQLEATAMSKEPATGGQAIRLRAENSKVDVPWVDAPPAVNCFFFTH